MKYSLDAVVKPCDKTKRRRNTSKKLSSGLILPDSIIEQFSTKHRTIRTKRELDQERIDKSNKLKFTCK